MDTHSTLITRIVLAGSRGGDLAVGRSRGFTLLETIVALAVIMAAVVGPVALITRGIFSASFSKNKLIATNLAQEGIELVRTVRDNNVLCDTTNGTTTWEWNRNPGGGFITDGYYAVYVNAVTAIQRSNCNTLADIPTPLLSPTSAEGEVVRFDGQVYGNSGVPTIFRRGVFVDFSPATPDSGIPAQDQLDIISRVTWNEKGIPRNIELRERLYNWR